MSGLFRWLRAGYVLNTPPPRADERIRYGPDPLHFADLRLPTGVGPHPVAVVIHGGFWRNRYSLDHIGHLSAALTASGVATWTIEYRRISDPGGGYPGTFQDVAAGVAHLQTIAPAYNLDLGRVAAIGHSAGGQLALWLLGMHTLSEASPLHVDQPVKLRGAVSLAGVLDLRRAWELRLSGGVVGAFLGGTPEELPERYAETSPIALLPLGAPHVLVHGTEDENVPLEISERYYEAARAAGDDARLMALPGTAHFELIDPMSAQFRTVREAVRSLL